MLRCLIACALFLATLSFAGAQQALTGNLNSSVDSPNDNTPSNAWIDLRQTTSASSKVQSAPRWVEAVTLAPASSSTSQKTTFRIRITQPKKEYNTLLFRLFFDDKPNMRPDVVAWNELGTQVLRSQPLGSGLNLATSETIYIPMLDVSCIDVEVPGDGSSIRGAYLDWMTSSEVMHPVDAESRDVIPEPFSAVAALHAPQTDTEAFGAVTATLAAESIPIGPSVQNGAAFQFGVESMPLAALLTFEVASPRIDAAPEIYLNGEDMGPVNLALPDLADPGYRGEAASLVRQMHFQYTGWLRAQKLIPLDRLKTGTNNLLITSGAGTPASAIRATQLQLKYLWDKSDYVLQPSQ